MSALANLRQLTARLQRGQERLDTLRDQHTAAIVAARAEGHPLRELAEAAGVSHETVRSTLRRNTR